MSPVPNKSDDGGKAAEAGLAGEPQVASSVENLDVSVMLDKLLAHVLILTAINVPDTVGWPQRSENPYNWSLSRKFSISVVYSFGQLVTLMTASMIAPALKQIGEDLHMTESTAQLSFSVYFLGLGFAPFSRRCSIGAVWAQASVDSLQHAWYIIWNTLSPVGKSRWQ